MSEAQLQNFGFGVTAAMVVAWSLLLPMSNTLVCLLVPIALSFSAFTKKLSWAVLTIVSLAAILFWTSWLGLKPFGNPHVPESISYPTLMALSLVGAWIRVGHNRSILYQHIARIREQESKAVREEAALRQKRKSLEKTNVSLRKASKLLASYVTTHAKHTEELSRKLGDQQGINQAIHHDLREPLRNIVSFTQLIERRIAKDPQGAAVQQYLTFASDGGRRIAGMLDDLLRYTRHEDEPLRPIDLNLLLQEVVTDLSETIHRHGGEVTARPLRTIQGYGTQLRQLFQNLISNALKFRRPGVVPRVDIQALSTAPDTVTLVVTDNGIGIPAKRIHDVFGLFNRVHGDQGFEGSGVGLALCRRIALSHGAAINVQSVVGEGSQFEISGLQLTHDECPVAAACIAAPVETLAV